MIKDRGWLSKMKWSEICIHTSNEAVEPISNILHEAGASGVVIEDSFELDKEREELFGEVYELTPEDYPTEGVIIKAYFPVNSFLVETIEDIKEAINNLTLYDIDLGPNKISISEIDDEDWATAWKKYYNPIKISEKFTIVPTWEKYEPVQSDEIIIELDPGMAFGTGTHPTTVMSIQSLEKIVQPGDTVIDVGTGSGVLSIAAALLGAKEVIALDLDEIAVTSAKFNCELNKVQEIVTVRQNNLLDGIEVQADVIVANILAEVIVRLSGQAYKNLKPHGIFITSGIINQKRDIVEQNLKENGFTIIETLVMEDWVTLVAKKQN